MYSWIELVVEGNLSFSAVEKDVFRKHVKIESISTDTLMRYMEGLTKIVEKKIGIEIGSRFVWDLL